MDTTFWPTSGVKLREEKKMKKGRPQRVEDQLLITLVENRLKQNLRVDATGIANVLGVNRSIICRQLQRLGYTREVTGDVGRIVLLSWKEIDRRVREAIHGEDKGKPLSDPKLLEVLGFPWSIRMMTKARLRLGIAGSWDRRKAYKSLGY